MVRVLEECELPRPQQGVLIAMAENASDEGTHCFPSVDKIAWKAGYKPRAVVDIMRELRKAGIIREVKPASGRRPAEYTIHLDQTPHKMPFEQWQALHGRHRSGAENAPVIEAVEVQSHESRDAENAPVQNDEGCNFTSLEVHSHVLGVQSRVSVARENAPEPVREPAIQPVREPVLARPLPTNGAAQQIVKAFCEAVGIPQPGNYSKAVGQAQQLVKAGLTPEQVPEIVGWLFSDSFWAAKGIDMGTVLSQYDKWRAALNAPKQPVQLRPGQRMTGEQIMARANRAREASNDRW